MPDIMTGKKEDGAYVVLLFRFFIGNVNVKRKTIMLPFEKSRLMTSAAANKVYFCTVLKTD